MGDPRVADDVKSFVVWKQTHPQGTWLHFQQERWGFTHYIGDKCKPDGHATRFVKGGYKPLWGLSR